MSSDCESLETTEISLLEIPDPVRKLILDKLSLKDILNLRFICHTVFQWIQEYYHPYLRDRLTSNIIRLHNPTLIRIFTDSVQSLPFTHFHIHVESQSFNRNSSLQRFAAKFAPSIHHLKISDMSFCSSDEEYNFYNSMTSLKSLEVYSMGPHLVPRGFKRPLYVYSNYENTNLFPTIRTRIPQTFLDTLESFKVQICMDSFYPYAILASCPRLKSFSAPRFGKGNHLECIELRPESITIKFLNAEITEFTQSLRIRKSAASFKPVDIKLNFTTQNWRLNLIEESVARDFLETIGAGGIKLLNANSLLINVIHDKEMNLDKSTIKNVLDSLKSLEWNDLSVQLYEMVNLERLGFYPNSDNAGSRDDFDVQDNWTTSSECPKFPSLYRISGIVAGNEDSEVKVVLLDFLLKPLDNRTNVKEVSFEITQEGIHLTPEHFSSRFPNLQKLHMKNVNFNNTDYSRLFLLLGIHTKIRSIELRSFVPFDDETFIGPPGTLNDDLLPYFSTLKHLEKFDLVIYNSDYEIPCGITDKVFTTVFHSMRFTAFSISGCSFFKLSSSALEALVVGEFSENICSFYIPRPLTSFSDEDATEFERLYNILIDLTEANTL